MKDYYKMIKITEGQLESCAKGMEGFYKSVLDVLNEKEMECSKETEAEKVYRTGRFKMRNCYNKKVIRVSILAGTDVETAITESIKLCKDENLDNVLFSFNGCNMSITKTSSIKDMVSYYGININIKTDV